jgi:hypothetical protein
MMFVGATAVTVALLGTTVVLADTTSFQSQYQSNATEDASLVQTAQASSVTSSTISTISSLVENLNSQISTLYSAEQTLTSQTLPTGLMPTTSAGQSTWAQLEQQRQSILHESQSAWNNVNRYFHRNQGEYEHYRSIWSNYGQQLTRVNSEIANDTGMNSGYGNNFGGYGSSQSFSNALSDLQNSILRLQQSAIQYTQEWIQLEQAGSSGGSTSSTVVVGTNAVTPTLAVVTDSNGGYDIDVSNATPGGTILLYNSNGTEISSAVADDSGDATFIEVPSGTYYGVDSVNGQNSAASSTVTVS